ncbi:MAG: hypothetical protein U1C57_03765, partial [Candidatus Doudnabacteria bacterium]|nr:hypothetical protein [Candidatus Doudnabacteria bacterium]
MSFFSDILRKLKKPVDALKDFLTLKERTSLQEKEKLSPIQRVETKLPSFEYKPPSFEGLKSFASSFIPPKEAFERKELAPKETPEERAARLAKAHETTKKIAEFGKAVLRAGPRAAASVTLEAQRRRTMIPETKAEKFLFGQEPLESITERIERFPERAKEFGISEPVSKKIAPFAVVGLTALDILPPLPGKAGLKGVAKKALTTKTAKEFAKAITEKEAGQILKAGFKSVDDFFKVAKKPAAKASLKIVDELKAVASTKKELESLKLNPLVEAKTQGYKVTNISSTPLGKQKGFAYRIEKGMDKMYAKNEAEIADLIKPGSRAIPAKLQPVTKDEMPKVIMDEAQSAKDFALSKINNQEWMSGASKVSQDMVRDNSKKSVQQIAKEKFDYLKYRAGMVDKDGYPLDKAAQSKLAEATKSSIPKELESFVPKVGKHKDVNSFI